MHGFDHRHVEWPYAVSRKIHDVAGNRRWRLRQEYTQPAILERLEQVANLPATLDADQCRLYAARAFELGKLFGCAAPLRSLNIVPRYVTAQATNDEDSIRASVSDHELVRRLD